MSLEQNLLVDSVLCFSHAELGVDRAGGSIVPFHVKAKPTHLRVALGSGLDRVIQGSIDAAFAELGWNIDALDPPENPVSPVAPFLVISKDPAIRPFNSATR